MFRVVECIYAVVSCLEPYDGLSVGVCDVVWPRWLDVLALEHKHDDVIR